MNFFKIGIIGFGNVGKKRYEALKKIKKFNIKVEYISDINKKLKIPNNIRYINNWTRVSSINVNLIIVSTPTSISETIAKNLQTSSIY